VADVYRWESPGRAADPILGAPAFRVTDPIACTCAFGFRFDASFVMAALHQLGVRWSWPYLSISTGTQVTFVRLFGGTDPLVDHLGRPAGIAARSYDGPAFSATGVMDLPLSSAAYALAAIPPGAGLVYVAVPLRNVGFFEPAYVLPDGRIVSALTQDELA
jgi:hypothetical protein